MDDFFSKSVDANLKYCFHFTQHLTNLQLKFEETISNEEITDTILECDGFIIPCHRIILIASSNYFDRLFKENTAVKDPRGKPIIPIVGIGLYEMKAILRYMYRGEVEIAQEEVHLFLKAAKELEVTSIVNAQCDLSQDNSYGLISPVKRVNTQLLLPLKTESIKTQTHQICLFGIGSNNVKLRMPTAPPTWPISKKIETKSLDHCQRGSPMKFEPHLILIPCQQKNDEKTVRSLVNIPTSIANFSSGRSGTAAEAPNKFNIPRAHILDDQSTLDYTVYTNDQVCSKKTVPVTKFPVSEISTDQTLRSYIEGNISENSLNMKPVETSDTREYPPVKEFHCKRIFAPIPKDDSSYKSETKQAIIMKIRSSKDLKGEQSLEDTSPSDYFVRASQSTPSVCLTQPGPELVQGELDNIEENGAVAATKVLEDYSINSTDHKLQSYIDRQIAAEALLSLGRVIRN